MKFSKILIVAGLARKAACLAGQHLGKIEFISMGPSRKPRKNGERVVFYKCDDCGRVFEKDF